MYVEGNLDLDLIYLSCGPFLAFFTLRTPEFFNSLTKGNFMESKVKIFGHPVHPMLVAFPVAFYVSTFALYLTYQNTGDMLWFKFGVVANMAAVITAAVAAVPGFIDWLVAIPDSSHAKRTGLIHMAFNVITLVLFTIAAVINYRKWNFNSPDLGATLLLSGIGVLTVVAAGFFGWTLVQKYHVGVDLTFEQKSIEPTEKQKVFSNGSQQTVRVNRKQF